MLGWGFNFSPPENRLVMKFRKQFAESLFKQNFIFQYQILKVSSNKS